MTEKSYRYLRRGADPQRPYRRWIDPRFRTLRIADVVAYLVHRGWNEIAPDRPGCRAFQEPMGAEVEGRPLCQFVPDTEAADDYGQQMFELLTGLAEFEDRQAAEVIDDILRLVGEEPQRNGVAADQSTPAETTR